MEENESFEMQEDHNLTWSDEHSDVTPFCYIDNVMGLDLREKFQNDMKEMLRDGSLNDVCIKLHDGEFKANKSVLAKRCEYFAATFRWKSN